MPRGGRGGKGGGYGPKKNYKGQRRHFTDAEELKQQQERDKKQQDWRRQQGIDSDEEEEEGKEATPQSRGAPGDLPPSDSDSEEDSEDEERKAKGVEHLIDIQNPNRAGGRQLKKVTELDTGGKTQLTRREREEIEKQQAKARYQQLHMEGKTDEARADLARLAIIRKQREEAAKKREEERKAAEEAKGNKS
ncbi:28 kDa heat- and acid-stable phosphoprotein-like [Saccostrea echinata]|uniref:28 kDa heat- and acid-stable phosphoprotein-like n=1 Tax=Saccostrea echinata TaxID=191078 RepID=UPI002A82EB63|nr:28 kDa heat- and acid-stable phosphoprotein-like [Saccostrea echinata]